MNINEYLYSLFISMEEVDEGKKMKKKKKFVKGKKEISNLTKLNKC